MGQKRSKNIVPFGHSEGTWVLRRYLKHPGTQSTWTLKHSSSTWALKALYLANSWKSFNHTIQLCTQTLYTLSISFCLHSSLSPESEWEEWERVIDFAARILDLPLIYLTRVNLSLWRSDNLSLFYNYKKESYTLHRRICVTCKLEKQPLSGAICTENCFHETYGKVLRTYPLRRVILVTLKVKL